MNLALAFLVIVASTAFGALLFFLPRTAEAAIPDTPGAPPAMNDLQALYIAAGARRGVDPVLLRALAQVESSENPDAVRWNPPYDCSVGLMQILAIPPKGFIPEPGADYTPTNKFQVEGWPVTFQALKNPAVNLDIGAQILAWNLATFGYPKGIAVYNSWSARNDPDDGPFMNQAYVAKVLRHVAALTGA